MQNESDAALLGFPVAGSRFAPDGRKVRESRSPIRNLSGLAAPPRALPSPSVRPAAARASAQGVFVGPTGTADLAGRRPRPIAPGAPTLPARLRRRKKERAQAPRPAPPAPPPATPRPRREARSHLPRSLGSALPTPLAAAEPGSERASARPGPPHAPSRRARGASPTPLGSGSGSPGRTGGGGRRRGGGEGGQELGDAGAAGAAGAGT